MSTRTLTVHKMHGTGNDFVVVDGRESGVMELFKVDSGGLCSFAAELGHRRFGLGFDQLLLIDNPTDSASADVFMRIFNADGSVAEMCGNGVRCAAFYVRHVAQQVLAKDSFKVETLSRIVTVTMLSVPRKVPQASLIASVVNIRVDMGFPDLLSSSLSVSSLDTSFTGYSISMGNPHFIIFLSDQKDANVRLSSLDSFPVASHGPTIESMTQTFPNKTNVEFVTATSTQFDAVRMRVWERGSGETLSCGSGACAVGAASLLRSITLNKPIDNHTIDVHLPGGLLTIEWNPELNSSGLALHPLSMTGPAALIGKTEIEVLLPI